jgi:PEGA domain
MKAAGTSAFVSAIAALAAIAASLVFSAQATAEELKITSTPPGASLEIDGVSVGKTPYKVKYPGGYFHKPHTAFGTRLEHGMVARISLSGYVTQEVTLTDGPLVWVAVNGRRQGNYFILKSDHFNIDLEPRVKLLEGSFEATQNAGPLPHHAPETRPPDRAPSRPQTEAPSHSEVNATASVSITCDLPSAEIYIDGKFVGQAPATLHLTAGSHRVEVRSDGKRTWSRDLEVLKDSQITLHPVLQAP